MAGGLSRSFALYWAATTVSGLGSGVSLIALPLLAVDRLGASGTAVGLLRAAETAPYIVLGVAIGMLVDRQPRHSWLMVAADLARAVLIGVIALLSVTGILTLPLLVLLAVMVGSCTVLYDIAQFSLLPGLVDRDHLVSANSAMELARGASGVLGPGIGGTLVAALRASNAVLVDAASYLVSAFCLSRVRTATPLPRTSRTRITTGLRAVFGSPYLRPMTTYLGINNLLNQAFLTAMVVFLAIVARTSGTVVGLVFGAYGVGFAVGAVSASWANRVLGLGRGVCLSSGLGALGIVIVALPVDTSTLQITLAMLGAGILGLSGPLFNVQSVALKTAVTPTAVLGAVTAAVKLVSQGALPLGAAFGGWLVTVVRPHWAFATLGVLSLAATAILVFSAVRPLESLPSPQLVTER